MATVIRISTLLLASRLFIFCYLILWQINNFAGEKSTMIIVLTFKSCFFDEFEKEVPPNVIYLNGIKQKTHIKLSNS